MADARKSFLEFIAAHTNARTGRLTIIIQLLAITLALSLSTFFLTARDPFSMWKENARLREELREVQGRSPAEQTMNAFPVHIDGAAREARPDTSR